MEKSMGKKSQICKYSRDLALVSKITLTRFTPILLPCMCVCLYVCLRARVNEDGCEYTCVCMHLCTYRCVRTAYA